MSVSRLWILIIAWISAKRRQWKLKTISINENSRSSMVMFESSTEDGLVRGRLIIPVEFECGGVRGAGCLSAMSMGASAVLLISAVKYLYGLIGTGCSVFWALWLYVLTLPVAHRSRPHHRQKGLHYVGYKANQCSVHGCYSYSKYSGLDVIGVSVFKNT